MRLVLVRKQYPWGTTGQLFVDGDFLSYTLEDTVRDLKIPDQTAIPYGTYEVQLTQSQRFNRILPILLNVPGFTGIRIHGGNSTADTSGCVLVGKLLDLTTAPPLQKSQSALEDLLEKLGSATDKITITIG